MTSAIRLLVAILVFALVAPSAVLAAEPVTTGDTSKIPTTTELALPNGLRIILLEDHSYPVVSCLSWYKVGSRNEQAGTTGISHLLEHMLFGKVGSFRNGEIGASIARSGGQFNGYTSDDFITFFETLPAARLELALRIESERMRGAQFTDADVQEELLNVQREFETQARDPNAVLEREVRGMLYQHHPYHNPIIGARSDVENIKAAQVKAYYDKYFGPNNCTLIISGDFQPKQVTANIQRYFGGLAKAPIIAPAAPIAQEPIKGEKKTSCKYSGKTEALEIGYSAPALSDPDAPAMVVLEKLLNSPINGKLKKSLIEPKIALSSFAAFEPKKDPGFFGITATAIPATPGAQQKLTEAVDGVLTQLCSTPVSDADLKRARNQAQFAFASETEGPYRAGFHYGYFGALSNWKAATTWSDKLEAVTAADVQRVAKKYLGTEGRVVAWLAGASAPKAVLPKTDAKPDAKPDSPSTSPAPAKPSSPSTKPEHVRLTGFKENDDALGKAIPQAMPTAIPNAVQKLPKAIGNAPAEVVKELPNAVEKVPTVIKSLPSAVGNIPTAIRQIPSTLGGVPKAIKELPGAVTGLPGAAAEAVRDLPGAIVGIPGAAAKSVRELPGAIGNIPGATAGALKAVPGAIGTFATELGGIPSAIGRQLIGPAEMRVANGTARRVLKNGITVVVHESHLSPVVQIAGAARAGTAYEPAGKKGISTVTTALLNLGSSKRNRAQMLALQEDCGLSIPHMVSFDNDAERLQFTTRCLARDTQTQLEIIGETLANPLGSDEDFDRAKQATLSDIQRFEDTNRKRAGRAIYRSILTPNSPFVPDSPHELNRSISTLTAADAKKFLSSSVSASDTTIVMVGDINIDTASQLVEKVFAPWTSHVPHQKLAAHPNAKQVTRTAVPTRDRAKSTVAFGRLVTGMNTAPEYAHMLIADTAFSKHPLLSRMSQKLAAEQALAKAVGSDSIDSNLTRLADGAAWSIDVEVEPNAVPLTTSAIQNELQRFGRDGITQTEFVEARRYLLGSIPVRQLGTLGSTARTLLDSYMRAEHEHPEAALLASIRGCSLDSVNRAIKHSLRPDCATMIVVGNSQALRSTRHQVAARQEQQAQQQMQQAQAQAQTLSNESTPSPDLAANGAQAVTEGTDSNTSATDPENSVH